MTTDQIHLPRFEEVSFGAHGHRLPHGDELALIPPVSGG